MASTARAGHRTRRSTRQPVSMPEFMSPEDTRAWRQARTLADLADLYARWCHGDITARPGEAPGGLPSELRGIAPTLAAVNRAGYVITALHIGHNPHDTPDGLWQARSGVFGFADRDTATRVNRMARNHGFETRVLGPDTVRALRGIEVAMLDGAVTDRLGAVIGRGEMAVRFGACHRVARSALNSAYQVTVVDRAWSDSNALWDALIDEFPTA
jgi:hypothetical protein